MKKEIQYNYLNIIVVVSLLSTIYLDYLWYNNCTTDEDLLLFSLINIFWLIIIIPGCMILENKYLIFTKLQKILTKQRKLKI